MRVRTFDGPGHVRTPTYVRGKQGWVERVHGDFRSFDLPQDEQFRAGIRMLLDGLGARTRT